MSRQKWTVFGLLICLLTACGSESSTGPATEEKFAAKIPFEGLGSGLISFDRYEGTQPNITWSRYVLDVNARTASIRQLNTAGEDEEMRISPDGRFFASLKSAQGQGQGDWDVYLTDRDGMATRLTSDGGDKNTPNWSYDGSRIYYVQTIRSEDVVIQLTIASLTKKEFFRSDRGSAQIRAFLESSKGVFLYASPDSASSLIPFSPSPTAIFSVRADGTGNRELTPRISSRVRTPVWSPDGTKFAFGSYIGATVIYVANADGTSLRAIVRVNGGKYGGTPYSMCWTGDGSRILFVSDDDANLHVFSVRPDGSDLVQVTTGAVRDSNVSCSH